MSATNKSGANATMKTPSLLPQIENQLHNTTELPGGISRTILQEFWFTPMFYIGVLAICLIVSKIFRLNKIPMRIKVSIAIACIIDLWFYGREQPAMLNNVLCKKQMCTEYDLTFCVTTLHVVTSIVVLFFLGKKIIKQIKASGKETQVSTLASDTPEKVPKGKPEKNTKKPKKEIKKVKKAKKNADNSESESESGDD